MDASQVTMLGLDKLANKRVSLSDLLGKCRYISGYIISDLLGKCRYISGYIIDLVAREVEVN